MKRPLARSLAALLVLLSLGSPALAQVKSGSAASASGDAASASQAGSGATGGAAPSAISLQPLSLTGALQAGGAPALAPGAAPAAAAVPAAISAGVVVADLSVPALGAVAGPPAARAPPASPAPSVRAGSSPDRAQPFFDNSPRDYAEPDGHFFDGERRLDPLEEFLQSEDDPGSRAAAPRIERLVGFVKGLFADGISEPPAFDRPAVLREQNARLPARFASLTYLSRLPSAEAERLLEWIKTADIPVDAPLPYPSDTTYSLELELQVNRQLTAADMHLLFPGDALTFSQWADWRDTRSLPTWAWERAHKHVMSRLRPAMPRGWELNDGLAGKAGFANFIEITTNNGVKKYHENTPEDWDALVEGMRAVQAALPGGFYSAHIHTGRESLTRKGRLPLDYRRFAELYLGFEGFWRGLMGLPYEKLPPSAVHPDALTDHDLSEHSHWLNLSERFPTVENKNVSALFIKGETGANYLNPDTLRADLSGSFVFFDMVTRAEEFPLASLGLPVISGARPGRKQMFHFLDRAYGDDLTGKALALKRLSSLEPYNKGSGTRRAESMKQAFVKLGLEQVYNLHDAHEGWDERLTFHLLENDGRRLKRLARDLYDAGISEPAAMAMMPPEIWPALSKALADRPWLRIPIPQDRIHSFVQ